MVRSGYLVIVAVSFLLASETVSGCFLNSCPYRRYGRNVRCANCGPSGDGVCVAESICCTSKACFGSGSCDRVPTCSPKTCVIGESIGYCVSPVLCCSQDFCQQNMKCLLNRIEPQPHFPL